MKYSNTERRMRSSKTLPLIQFYKKKIEENGGKKLLKSEIRIFQNGIKTCK